MCIRDRFFTIEIIATGLTGTKKGLLAFLLEETARKILPEAVLACCVSGIIHVRCGYYRWGSRDAIRYSDIDAASVCIGSHSAG